MRAACDVLRPIAYQVYEEALASPRWQALAAKGARMQRLLWASTGVKDKGFEDTRYVTELVAPDTVNTMPEATLQAVADHGRVRGDTIRGSYDAAHAILADLAWLGADMADVAMRLEEQGIASLAKSWDELIASVTEQVEKAGAEVMSAGAVTPASGDGGQTPAPAAAAPGRSSAAAKGLSAPIRIARAEAIEWRRHGMLRDEAARSQARSAALFGD